MNQGRLWLLKRIQIVVVEDHSTRWFNGCHSILWLDDIEGKDEELQPSDSCKRLENSQLNSILTMIRHCWVYQDLTSSYLGIGKPWWIVTVYDKRESRIIFHMSRMSGSLCNKLNNPLTNRGEKLCLFYIIFSLTITEKYI